jgi:peptide/nickel transport system substrate-binding protein
MRRIFRLSTTAALLLAFASCGKPPDANTLVMMIESSPANLDPRIGLDAQSERIDELIFDALLTRDEHLNVEPGIAEKWEIPDALTYVFKIRKGAEFHDGRPLTARDVKWTFDSLLQGTVRSTKASAYRFVDHIDASDDFTVVFHLKEPDASLLWNLSEGAIGIVPAGSGVELAAHPVGSGPFRFVSAEPDKEVVLTRNQHYWGGPPKLDRVRFMVVPDATTRALELRKGSADVTINALAYDTLPTLEKSSQLQILHSPGTVLAYLGFNLRDRILKDVRVRQAISCAINREQFVHYLFHDYARPALSLLPPESWAYEAAGSQYIFDPARAKQLLDAAGFPLNDGARFHLTIKTSTDEGTRLLAAVLQQQLRDVGIVLDIRTFEFATFFSDVTRGEFQLYSLRWIGGNEDPDIYEYVYHSSRFPPKGANRGYYANPRVDLLIDQARVAKDQAVRKQLYAEIQSILAEDVPSVNLWYLDNVLVAAKRVKNLTLNPSGNYNFLKTAELDTSAR